MVTPTIMYDEIISAIFIILMMTMDFVLLLYGLMRVSVSSTSSTTSSTVAPSTVSRRPFRVASRRRLSTTSTTTTTTEQPETTTAVFSEEILQDIGDTEVIEEPSFDRPNRTKTQRRPLLLKQETEDQNPSATNEEERKRHSKKYSASFKQNQLDEVLKQRAKLNSQEDDDTDLTPTTETSIRTTLDDYNAETALAIAAHQLLSAPLPTVHNYDDAKPKKSKTTTFEYKDTSPTYTEIDDTKLLEEISTPIYRTSPDYVQTFQTTTGTIYEAPSTFSNPTITTSTFTPRTSSAPSRFKSRVSKPAAFTTANVLTTLSEDPVEISRAPLNPTTSRISRPASFTTSKVLTTLSEDPGYSRLPVNPTSEFSRPKFSRVPTTAGYSSPSPAGFSTTTLIPVPVEDYSITTDSYTSLGQEPSYFTREYLLESPVTKTYDDEYQYLSPTTPQSTTRKIPKKIAYRKISTTLRPTVNSYLAGVTPPTARRVPARKPSKPFEKVVPKGPAPNRFKPIENYDYYDDGAEKIAEKYAEGTKVVLHSKGIIECLDIGNFPHPTSCKKFISCARLENGSFLGWEYICPKGLSFDPVGGICNWSAGLGCKEKDI